MTILESKLTSFVKRYMISSHAYRRDSKSNRSHLECVLVRRHLQSAGSHRADHLPAVHQRLDDLHTLEENKATRLKKPMERRVFPEGKDDQKRSPSLRRFPLVALQALRAGRDVHGRRRARLSVSAHARRRRLDLRAPHEGRALHDPDAGAAGEGRGHDRPGADGGSRHQGRPLRIHARQDRHRRAERPVPHAAPHHPADGRDDRAEPEGRHLRSRLRHCRLPRRGRRIPARASPGNPPRREAEGALPPARSSTASTSTTPCSASAA